MEHFILVLIGIFYVIGLSFTFEYFTKSHKDGINLYNLAIISIGCHMIIAAGISIVGVIIGTCIVVLSGIGSYSYYKE